MSRSATRSTSAVLTAIQRAGDDLQRVPATVYPAPRRRSLDVLRGLTVLGMVVVNAADLGGQAHPWLRHSLWNGCTPADLVFPAFLFIMGTLAFLPVPALFLFSRRFWWMWTGMSLSFFGLFGWLMPVLAER